MSRSATIRYISDTHKEYKEREVCLHKGTNCNNIIPPENGLIRIVIIHKYVTEFLRYNERVTVI